MEILIKIFQNPMVAFVLLIGVVVLVHEAGHYLVGKALGIDAEEFSIGFGPKAFGFVWQGTEFKVCWLPLGGYVRFFGSEIGGEVAPERAHRALLLSPVYKRALISVAGPAANLILSFVVMAGLSRSGIPQPAPVVGVLSGSIAAEAGLRDGDRIVSISEQPIQTWKELSAAISSKPGMELVLAIERDGAVQNVRVTPRVDSSADLFGDKKTVGRIGVTPSLSSPRIVVKGEGDLGALGVRSGDVLSSLQGNKILHAGAVDGRAGEVQLERSAVDGFDALVNLLSQKPDSKKESKKDSKENNSSENESSENKSTQSAGGVQKVSVQWPGLKFGTDYWTTDLTLAKFDAPPKGDSRQAALDAWMACGLLPGDTFLSLQENGSARPLRNGSELFQIFQKRVEVPPMPELGAKEIFEWEVLGWGASASRMVRCEIPRRLTKDHLGKDFWTLDTPFQFLTAGISGGTTLVKSANVWEALQDGAKATGEQIATITTGLKKLVSGSLPLSNLGGPIAIARVAGDAATGGLLVFLMTISWLSINIGLLNMLPLPALDGGALLMQGVEAAYGRPLSVKVQSYVQRAGILFFLFLIVVVFYNDIVRLFTHP
jgi:regulator of sigma E protease